MIAADDPHPPDLADARDLTDGPNGRAAWTVGVTVVVTVAALAGLAMWAATLITAPLDADATPAADEAVIRAGEEPAVAATDDGRIVDVRCELTGPIVVAADGTGAFTVMGGAQRVDCPQEEFRRGQTLRWPADATPETVPPGSDR